ncbi:MAG: hypothetical protein R2752_23780 [Vicinamibacterales bacterium]
MTRTLSIETPIHGRVLVEDAAVAVPDGCLVLFHGYAQDAAQILADVAGIPGIDRWTRVGVQGLHRFYTRDQHVVASWMTRQDRDAAIADNVAYVDRALDAVAPSAGRLVFAGFSQGASMAYRAARLGRRDAHGIIALGGDLPPELRSAGVPARLWPPVLIGVGDREHWYTPDKVAADLAALTTMGAPQELVRFAGGHEWTGEFRAAAGRWLAALPVARA